MRVGTLSAKAELPLLDPQEYLPTLLPSLNLR